MIFASEKMPQDVMMKCGPKAFGINCADEEHIVLRLASKI
jgi:hypothetical protein